MKTGVKAESFDKYKLAHGVNQSRLKLLSRSPAHMRYALDHPEPSTLDQEIGQVFDIAVFQPDDFKMCCHVQPAKYDSGKDGMKPWHNGATFCKEWRRTHQDKPIIPQERYSNIIMMRDAVMKNPAAALILKQGRSGLSLYCEDAETGLQLKARPDWMTGNTIPDLKSCIDASETAFSTTIARFGYHVQAAFYLDVANVLKLEKQNFAFICCEKDPPFGVAVYQLEAQDIERGREIYRRLLMRYMECESAGKWPGYPTDIQYIGLPAWARRAKGEPIMALEVAA